MPAVSLNKIKVSRNRRPINVEYLEGLIESIKVNGLLNPITITQDYELLAGLHRLTACEMLGWEEIECTIKKYDNQSLARLAEIDENLIRNELSLHERDELWYEREQILERLGMRAKVGENQYTRVGGDTETPPTKTTVDIAKETGYSERTYQRGKQIIANLAPEVRKSIRTSTIANSIKYRQKVARAGTEERKNAERVREVAKQKEAEVKAALQRQEEALAKFNQEEARKQAAAAANARAEAERQKQLELELRRQQARVQQEALRKAEEEKKLKDAKKKAQQEVLHRVGQIALKQPAHSRRTIPVPKVKQGQWWQLGKHLLYCGSTDNQRFINACPKDAALAFADVQVIGDEYIWNHDYLANHATTVAVALGIELVHDFAKDTQLPYKRAFLAWVTGSGLYSGIYIALYSHVNEFPNLKLVLPVARMAEDTTTKPNALIRHLVELFSKPGQVVINPFLRNEKTLLICQELDRVLVGGDDSPEVIEKAISYWQELTGNTANLADSVNPFSSELYKP